MNAFSLVDNTGNHTLVQINLHTKSVLFYNYLLLIDTVCDEDMVSVTPFSRFL